jgi:hypothetical protein
MGILSKVSEGGNPTTYPITSVIGNDQVQPLLVEKGRDLIVIAYHLTIPMKK